MTTLATVSKNMMQRSVEGAGSSSSIMNSIHKVRVYNPNGFEGESMDEEKKGKLILTEAGTGDKKLIEPFKFNILAHYKVTQGRIPMLTPDEDVAVKSDGTQDIRYFYTNQYHKFLAKDQSIGFTCKGMKPLWFTKEDFFNFIKTPKVNGLPNPFFEWKKAKDGTKFKSSLLETQDVIYGVFVDGPYAGEYFQMKIKASAMGNNYNWETKSKVDAREGTITRILDDSLAGWNDILKSNGLKTVTRLEPEYVDFQLNVEQVDVSGKIFNIATFAFAGYTANRTDNTEDLNYIKDFNHKLFYEAFGEMSQPVDVTIEGVNANVNFDFKVSEEVSADVAEDVFSTTQEALSNGAEF